jgi:hypothetical protein
VSSLSYPGKGFKNDCLLREESLLNNPFGYLMIESRDKMPLTTANLSQMPLRAFRPLALKQGTDTPTLTPKCFHSLTRERLSVTIDSNLQKSQVNAENACNLFGRRVGKRNGDAEIVHSVAEQQVCLSHSARFQIGSLFSAMSKRKSQPPLRRGENRGTDAFEFETAGVENKGGTLTESVSYRAVNPVGISDDSDSANHQLRRQRGKPFPNGMVRGVMQIKLAEYFLLPCNLRQVVANLIKQAHCIGENSGCFLVGTQFTGNCFHHRPNIVL